MLCGKKPAELEWKRFKEHYLERLFDQHYHELYQGPKEYLIGNLKSNVQEEDLNEIFKGYEEPMFIGIL